MNTAPATDDTTRRRNRREIPVMFEIAAHSRNRVLAAAVVTGVWFSVAAPGAQAAPPPEPAAAQTASCPVGMDGLGARLRAAGLSAQAANVATQLVYSDCLAAHSIRS